MLFQLITLGLQQVLALLVVLGHPQLEGGGGLLLNLKVESGFISLIPNIKVVVKDTDIQ